MDIGEDIFMSKLIKKSTKIETISPKEIEYFHSTRNDKSNFVKARLLQMKQSLLESLKIDHFEPINHQSTKPFYTFGMISSPTGEKIESDSYLFNNTDNSNIPVKLDLSALDSYSIFNGQIVALKGINTRGDVLHVHDIYISSVLNINQNTKEQGSIIVSKGPFTRHRVECIFKKEASVYVFLGPFYEAEDDEPEFKSMDSFIECIQAFKVSKLDMNVIIVPSIDDLSSVRIFPQPAIKIISDNSIRSVPNPSYFYLNNHLVLVCNFDNFIDLCYEEVSSPPSAPDRFGRLCHHLVFQKCFVPVLCSKSNVAYGKWLEMDFVPDLYIIASKMKCFDRKIGPVTIANVGGLRPETFKIDCSRLKAEYKVENISTDESSKK